MQLDNDPLAICSPACDMLSGLQVTARMPVRAKDSFLPHSTSSAESHVCTEYSLYQPPQHVWSRRKSHNLRRFSRQVLFLRPSEWEQALLTCFQNPAYWSAPARAHKGLAAVWLLLQSVKDEGIWLWLSSCMPGRMPYVAHLLHVAV